MDFSMPGLPVPHHVPNFAQVHVHCIDDNISNLVLWCPLLLLPSIFPSIRDFSNESAIGIRWPKYWSFSFSISPSNEYSGLISFRIDWFDLLAVQGTLRSLFQHHSSKASILWCFAFFMVQFSQPYLTTGKTVDWLYGPLLAELPLLVNTMPRSVTAFLPRSNHLLISRLQSPSTVILEPKKRISVTTSTFPLPSAWINGAGCHGIFLIFSLKLAFSLCSFTLIKRLFNSSSLSAIRVVSSTYLMLLMFLLPISILACNSCSPAFFMMCSVYKLNKQGDSRQPRHTPFLILNQSVVPYRVLTVASWYAYRFLRK